jgi:hypothetical protein
MFKETNIRFTRMGNGTENNFFNPALGQLHGALTM